MNAQEALEAENALDYPYRSDFPDAESYKAARRAYTAELVLIRGEFQRWLGQRYASGLPLKVQEMIYDKAWDDGHAHGYHEVESHYENLADFTEQVRYAR